MLCGFINSDSKNNKGKVRAMKGMETERRDDAMAKMNHKQESQAIKATKQCGRAAQAAGAGAGIGAVVSLKVDYRTHSQTCLVAHCAKSSSVRRKITKQK